ncbi:hypothetical protein [Nocardia thailandica]|uniref:hypothetical protein n=1 Tax=Nocardia thailandica TaxID=257275 RepID=UPI0012FBA75A|nr:hypothetical protein [Nocardia thailandica]
MSRTSLNYASADEPGIQSPDLGLTCRHNATSDATTTSSDTLSRPSLSDTLADLENAGLICSTVQPLSGHDDQSLVIEAYPLPVPKPTPAALTQVFEAMTQAGWL